MPNYTVSIIPKILLLAGSQKAMPEFFFIIICKFVRIPLERRGAMEVGGTAGTSCINEIPQTYALECFILSLLI